jgi:L-lactate dehydrogenase complex protein LldG
MDLPVLNVHRFKTESNVKETFAKNIESVGGKICTVTSKSEVLMRIKTTFPDVKEVVSCVEGVDIGTVALDKKTSAKELEKLDLALLEGQCGVAENGAVWISDKNMFHRSIPFITSHLVLILSQEHLVENMHEACERIAHCDDGYGVFISGPSKTADIEQSLVIGAQAALSLTVYIISNS